MSIVREKYFEWRITPIDRIPHDVKIFTIVRDPFERCVSSYIHLKKYKSIKYTPKEYLEKIKKEGFFDSHCWPQVAHLEVQDFNNKLMENCIFSETEIRNNSWDFNGRSIKKIDLFLRHEHLNQDIKQYISEEISLGFLNSNKSKKTPSYNQFKRYDNVIKNLYSKDYDLLKSLSGHVYS